ncbi:thioredoxin-disulfide reductase [Candidatus Microgenomates bacterium]|nr:thioredoxin-disulfide reductase [Candidatus Microgenomates bacterium]
MPNTYDIAVIGSGPASLTAAIYTSRGAAKTVILAGSNWGGQLMLTTEVENFPGFDHILGPELMAKMKNHAVKFGSEFIGADVEEVDFSRQPFTLKANGKDYQTKSVIITTGANARWLNLPSEREFIGRGVSSCAPCDAPFFKEKNVIVVGGGDSAMEEALVLTKYAASVTIVHRRSNFRASKIMQSKVLNHPKIKVIWDTEVTEILGTDKVSGVKLKNVKTGETRDMPIDGVFVAIGHDPNTKLFAGKLELDEKGYIKIISNSKFLISNEKGEEVGNRFSTMTSIEGIFAAGDVHDFRYRQAITAAGFGCQAAMDALSWLEEVRP